MIALKALIWKADSHRMIRSRCRAVCLRGARGTAVCSEDAQGTFNACALWPSVAPHKFSYLTTLLFTYLVVSVDTINNNAVKVKRKKDRGSDFGLAHVPARAIVAFHLTQ